MVFLQYGPFIQENSDSSILTCSNVSQNVVYECVQCKQNVLGGSLGNKHSVDLSELQEQKQMDVMVFHIHLFKIIHFIISTHLSPGIKPLSLLISQYTAAKTSKKQHSN
jgi:hypothetical protein